MLCIVIQVNYLNLNEECYEVSEAQINIVVSSRRRRTFPASVVVSDFCEHSLYRNEPVSFISVDLVVRKVVPPTLSFNQELEFSLLEIPTTGSCVPPSISLT